MTPLQIACDYIDRGWNPVPCDFKSKKPIGDDWQLRVIDAANAPQYFNTSSQNIGAQMGPRSHGLTDVDLDCVEAVAIAPYILPKTDAIFGRASKRASHWLYTTTLASVVDDACLIFDDPDAKEKQVKARLVELRIGGGDKGAQTVLPGSVHQSGEPIQWEQNGNPAVVDGTDLIRRVRLIAAASLIARAWPAEGARHDAALTLGGFFARARLSETDMKTIVQAIARAAGDREWKDRVRAAQDHAQHHAQTGTGRGFPSLIELAGDKAATRIAEWLDYTGADRFQSSRTSGNGDHRTGNHSWDEPDISLLDDRRGEVPREFPLDVFCSAPLQDWITRAAHGSGTSVAHVAVPLIGIASSLIGTARRVQASRSFLQPMTCWTALVGFSGSGKTPGIDATKRALAMLERNRKHKIAAMERAHDTQVEKAKFLRDQWKDELKAALKDGNPQPLKPPQADDPGKFVTPRLYVSDATIERLGVLLQARPQGMLMLVDELAGLFMNLSRYTTGQDDEFWLEAWNGAPYVIERMNRPSISLDHFAGRPGRGPAAGQTSHSLQGRSGRHVCPHPVCLARRTTLPAVDRRGRRDQSPKSSTRWIVSAHSADRTNSSFAQSRSQPTAAKLSIICASTYPQAKAHLKDANATGGRKCPPIPCASQVRSAV